MSILEQTPTTAAVLVDGQGIPPRGPFAVAWTFLQRQPVGAIGMVLVLIFGLAGIFAEWIAPYSPTANDFAAMTEPMRQARHRPARARSLVAHPVRRAHRLY